MRESKIYWYWLCNCKGIGIRKIGRLLKIYQKPEDIYYEKRESLEKLNFLTDKDVSELTNQYDLESIEKKLDQLKEKGILFLTAEDEAFPEKLKNIYDAPVCLYLKGKLPDKNRISIAVIGARNCSCYGKEVAMSFSKELSKAGIQVISGMAMGIDSYSHYGALRGDTPTFAVLGSGIDVCYPTSNIELYMKIQEKGGIISEYPPGTGAKPGYFPMRNRIISALSDGILVVEAREKSGTFITVDYALEQGKEVFAIPGNVGDKLSEGCNNLIKMGAHLASTPQDITDNYSLQELINCKKVKKNDIMLETNEKIVYSYLSLEPKHMNQIAAALGLSMETLIDIIVQLEIKGVIKQVVKNYYITNTT